MGERYSHSKVQLKMALWKLDKVTVPVDASIYPFRSLQQIPFETKNQIILQMVLWCNDSMRKIIANIDIDICGALQATFEKMATIFIFLHRFKVCSTAKLQNQQALS